MKTENIDYSNESILIVDDDAGLTEVFQELLDALGFYTKTSSNGPNALKLLEERKYTFLLTDMKMPDMDGMELIGKVSGRYPDMSVIAMTGFSQGYKYIDVINAGAGDFIKKPFDLGELEAKIRRIINERNLREELNRLSITDSLTGLYNQRQFYTRLKEEILRATRQKNRLALILFDLDDFKAYNDTFGHLAGDEVLQDAGKFINQSIRESVDSGYRYGGDEFAIILIDADSTMAQEIGKRIQESFKENTGVTASLGYTKFSQGMSVKDLVSEADKNLYRAKLNKKK
jgi:diguanylate cyclase (GGDEF)-like protein